MQAKIMKSGQILYFLHSNFSPKIAPNCNFAHTNCIQISRMHYKFRARVSIGQKFRQTAVFAVFYGVILNCITNKQSEEVLLNAMRLYLCCSKIQISHTTSKRDAVAFRTPTCMRLHCNVSPPDMSSRLCLDATVIPSPKNCIP